jgi:hypothetical protein
MIVTDSTLVGYTMINGTWGLQMALFIASLFNYLINPDLEYTAGYPDEDKNAINLLRKFVIPLTHGALMIMCFIVSSDRIPWDGLKQGLNFAGMLLYIEMILQCSLAMGLFQTPISTESLQLRSAFIWLEIEQLVFMSTLFSNVIFLLIRSQVRHKLQLDAIDEKKQLPNVDTIIAISEVANAFHA